MKCLKFYILSSKGCRTPVPSALLMLLCVPSPGFLVCRAGAACEPSETSAWGTRRSCRAGLWVNLRINAAAPESVMGTSFNPLVTSQHDSDALGPRA